MLSNTPGLGDILWATAQTSITCLGGLVGVLFFVAFFFLTEKAEKEITHFLCKLILLRYRTAQLQGRFPGAGRSGRLEVQGSR